MGRLVGAARLVEEAAGMLSCAAGTGWLGEFWYKPSRMVLFCSKLLVLSDFVRAIERDALPGAISDWRSARFCARSCLRRSLSPCSKKSYLRPVTC